MVEPYMECDTNYIEFDEECMKKYTFLEKKVKEKNKNRKNQGSLLTKEDYV